jgi:hypothetical protein
LKKAISAKKKKRKLTIRINSLPHSDVRALPAGEETEQIIPSREFLIKERQVKWSYVRQQS